MHIEHLSHWSGNLNREMYVNRYGHGGIPVVVFASSGGSHNEYYDFGMIDACASFIEEGRVQFFTLSSVDSESWLATWKNSHDQAEMHRAYERYVIEEAAKQMIRSKAFEGVHKSIFGEGDFITNFTKQSLRKQSIIRQ